MRFKIHQPQYKGLWRISIICKNGYRIMDYLHGFDKKQEAKLALIQLKKDLKRLCSC